MAHWMLLKSVPVPHLKMWLVLEIACRAAVLLSPSIVRWIPCKTYEGCKIQIRLPDGIAEAGYQSVQFRNRWVATIRSTSLSHVTQTITQIEVPFQFPTVSHVHPQAVHKETP